MKRQKMFIASIVLCFALFASTFAHAREVRMIFWYPGEAGTTVEAKPVLQFFFDYISKKIAPDSMNGNYYNTVDAGLAAIKKEKPVVAIISYAALTQNMNKLGDAEVFLATLPTPFGKTTEKYAIVGRENKIPAGATVFSSEPLSMDFVRKELFPAISADVKLVSTNQMLLKLKEIGDGKLVAHAILTPTEAFTLSKLSQPWAKNLVTVSESSPVPSAKVVLLDKKWEGAAKLKSALLLMGNDPAAADVLSELRLKGFAEK